MPIIQILYNIWQFLQELWTVVHTLWFAIVHGIRFVFRMVAAVIVFISNFPETIAAVLVIGLTVGLALFALGRN